MASKKKTPHDAYDALIDALYEANDAREADQSFEENLLDLEDAFNRVMKRLL